MLDLIIQLIAGIGTGSAAGSAAAMFLMKRRMKNTTALAHGSVPAPWRSYKWDLSTGGAPPGGPVATDEFTIGRPGLNGLPWSPYALPLSSLWQGYLEPQVQALIGNGGGGGGTSFAQTVAMNVLGLAAGAAPTGAGSLTTVNGVATLGLVLGIPAGAAGAPGPAPVFGTPTATELLVGAIPTVSVTGTGVAGSPLVLSFGLPPGAAGPAPVFGTPTATLLAAGQQPTVSYTGNGTAANPLVLALGIPVGTPGTSPTINSTVAIAVTGLAAGQSPTGSASYNNGTIGIALAIPAGLPGTNGLQGPAPVFGTPTVTPLAAGQPPTVSTSGSGTTASPLVLALGLPAGATGLQGPAGGSPAAAAFFTNSGTYTIPFGTSTPVLDFAIDLTLEANTTFVFSGGTAGYLQTCTMFLRQNSTGNYTWTLPSNATWAVGSPLAFSYAPNTLYILQFTTIDGGKTFVATVIASSVNSNSIGQAPANRPGIPNAPNVTATAASGQVTLAITQNLNNGAAITGMTIWRGTSSGGETVLASNISPVLSYVDSTVTNGTTYYYYVTVTNSAGTSNGSVEVSASPQSAHNLVLPGTTAQSVSTPLSSALELAGFVDIQIQLQLSAFPTSGNAQDMVTDSYCNSTNTQGFNFFINSAGTIEVFYYSSGAVEFPPVSTAALPASVLNAPIWLRAILNTTNASVTENGVTYAANTCTYQYSTNGTTWTTLGSVVQASGSSTVAPMTAPTGGNLSIGIAGSNNATSLAAKVFQVLLYNSSGTVVANPVFTSQATGTTSFTDAAGNTWTVAGSGTSIT